MKNVANINVNTNALNKIVKLTKLTTDHLINMEVDGILKKPTSGNAILEFDETMNDLLFNKLRKKLGV